MENETTFTDGTEITFDANGMIEVEENTEQSLPLKWQDVRV